MIARKRGKRAYRYVCRCEERCNSRHEPYNCPRQFNVQRQQPVVSLHLRVSHCMTNPLPVFQFEHERNFMRVTKNHERHINLWTELWILKQVMPIVMADAGDDVSRGCNFDFGPV